MLLEINLVDYLLDIPRFVWVGKHIWFCNNKKRNFANENFPREANSRPAFQENSGIYLLTPSSTVLLEKLTGFQLIKKFPAFYGTRRFITVFTSGSYLSLSWARSILSMLPNPTSWRCLLIWSSHLLLGFPSGLFPLGFHTKTLYTPLYIPVWTDRRIV